MEYETFKKIKNKLPINYNLIVSTILILKNRQSQEHINTENAANWIEKNNSIKFQWVEMYHYRKHEATNRFWSKLYFTIHFLS